MGMIEHVAIGAVPGLPPIDAHDNYWNMPFQWRQGYVNTKYSVAMHLQPKRICEIGVYSGIAALSFLAASPKAEYLGFDSLLEETNRKIVVVQKAKETMRSLGYKAEVIVEDSQMMTHLPGQFDFVHVDGDHSREGAKHDVLMAWEALTPNGHILIDNGHDMGVAAGVFDAMYFLVYHKQLVEWRYFEDSVGSILIYKEPFKR